jgi:hypothetical protein
MNNLIFQQIPKVMAEIGAIAKSNRNQTQGYNFRGIDDVYNELHPLLAKHKIFSTTNVLEQDRMEKPSKNGGVLNYSILKIKFTFFAEDGSFVEVSTVGEGMDSGDKSSNKAMAVAHKYALMQLFSIPTHEEKDSEFTSPEPKFIPKQESNKVDLTPLSPPLISKSGPSDAQLKRLFAIGKSNDWKNEEIKELLLSKFGLKSSSELNKNQYNDLCDFLQSNKSMGNLPH